MFIVAESLRSVYRKIKSQDGFTNVMVTSLVHFKQIHMSLREKSCRLADAYINNRIL